MSRRLAQAIGVAWANGVGDSRVIGRESSDGGRVIETNGGAIVEGPDCDALEFSAAWAAGLCGADFAGISAAVEAVRGEEPSVVAEMGQVQR